MPGTVASFGRRSAMSWSTGLRWLRGLSRTKIRPLFEITLVPLAPMNDMNCST